MLHRLDCIQCTTPLEVELLAALVHERRLRLMGPQKPPPAPPPTDLTIAGGASVRQIQVATCRRFGITVNEILAGRRQNKICLIRHLAVVLCQALTSCSYPQLGRMFMRDHTTMLNSARKFEWLKRELTQELSRNDYLVVWVERAAIKVDSVDTPVKALPEPQHAVA